MARYGVETNLSAEEALQRAAAYFGVGGLGLDVVEQEGCFIRLEGGGGHVLVTANPGDKKATTVDLETREWDYHVKRFMAEIGRA